MKIKILFAFGILIFGVQVAKGSETDLTACIKDPLSTNLIPTIPVKLCDYWTWIRDSHGMTVYACATYPIMTIAVPDGRDVQRVVDAMETRIANLEKRVAELENPHPR